MYIVVIKHDRSVFDIQSFFQLSSLHIANAISALVLEIDMLQNTMFLRPSKRNNYPKY